MTPFDQYAERLHRLQAMIWIEEERLVDELHCIRQLNQSDSQQMFR